MKTVVSNTTPLITLASIDKLEILHRLFGQIIIPTAVKRELDAGEGKTGYFDVASVDWIIPRRVKNVVAVGDLDILGDGEAETIVLAEEIRADKVLIDEKFARHFAIERGLILSGSLGVIMEAKRQGIIPEIRPLIEKMLVNERYLSRKLIHQILMAANEL